MNATEAAQVLRSIAYRPGWQFDAIAFEEMEPGQKAIFRRVLGDDVSSLVLFRYVFDTVDTNQEYAADGYQQPKTLEDSQPLDAADFKDADDLMFAVFNQLMRIELHESREYFRRKDQNYAAPFHPHRPEGEALWEKCNEETN